MKEMPGAGHNCRLAMRDLCGGEGCILEIENRIMLPVDDECVRLNIALVYEVIDVAGIFYKLTMGIER